MPAFNQILRMLPSSWVFRLRGLANQHNLSMSSLPKALLKASTPKRDPLKKTDSIVVVGAGVAGIRTVQGLHRLGFSNLTLVSENEAFGGVCVHQGCMPLEYFWSKGGRVGDEEQELFRLNLARNIEDSVKQKALFKKAKVVEVQNQTLVLEGSEKLSFRHLVLATGKSSPSLPQISNTLSLPELWRTNKKRVIIYNKGFLEIWSLVALLTQKNCEVMILHQRPKSFFQLPSFEEFKHSMPSQVQEFYEVAELSELNESEAERVLKFEHSDGITTVNFDEIFPWGGGALNLPKIDGRAIGFLDVEKDFRVFGRSDISVVGDVSGMMSAAEAEVQAQFICDSLSEGTALFEHQALPFRIHGKRSWAAAGELWTLFEAKSWRRIDFQQLGWSAAHQQEGSLWFLYEPSSKKVLGVQIFHSQAGELISIAQMLLNFPVTDPAWVSSYVHPSAAEIFQVLALECRKLISETASAPTKEGQVGWKTLTVPKLELKNIDSFIGIFGLKLVKSVLLSRDPQAGFAVAMLNNNQPEFIDRLTTNPNQVLNSLHYYYDRSRRKMMVFQSENLAEIHII